MQRQEIPVENPQEERRYDLERMTSGRDVEGLIETLQNGSPALRRSAALALGALGEWRAVDPLIRALADPAQAVREGAANALVTVGTPAVEPLIDLLDRPDIATVFGVPQGEEAWKGLTQVDLLGGPEGIPPEKRRLHHGGGVTQHDLFGGPEEAEKKRALQHRELAQHDLLAGPEGIREHNRLFPGAERAGITTEGAPPGMKPGLRRAYAAVILGEIADPRAEEVLTRSLSDSDPIVRRAAEDGLARFRKRRSTAAAVLPVSR